MKDVEWKRSNFLHLFKSEKLSDVKLSINGSVIPAHRVILASGSEKFSRELPEAANQTIQIDLPKDMESAFQDFIQYIYTTSPLVVTPENFPFLEKLAGEWEATQLQSLLKVKLPRLSPSQSVKGRRFPDLIDLSNFFSNKRFR